MSIVLPGGEKKTNKILSLLRICFILGDPTQFSPVFQQREWQQSELELELELKLKHQHTGHLEQIRGQLEQAGQLQTVSWKGFLTNYPPPYVIESTPFIN